MHESDNEPSATDIVSKMTERDRVALVGRSLVLDGLDNLISFSCKISGGIAGFSDAYGTSLSPDARNALLIAPIAGYFLKGIPEGMNYVSISKQLEEQALGDILPGQTNPTSIKSRKLLTYAKRGRRAIYFMPFLNAWEGSFKTGISYAAGYALGCFLR